MPLVGYYKVLTKNQADAGNDVFPTLVNYGNWRLAWYAFLSLLDINFKDGFTCEHCGCEPRTIVCECYKSWISTQIYTYSISKKE